MTQIFLWPDFGHCPGVGSGLTFALVPMICHSDKGTDHVFYITNYTSHAL